MISFKEFNDISQICKLYKISKYTINKDTGVVDVEGSVEFGYNSDVHILLEKLPIQFGRVTGNFDCGGQNLTTLKGSPYYVGGDFECFNNQLTSLKYCPETIIGDIDCSGNKLKNLLHGPKSINYKYDCSGNELTSLQGCPEELISLYCSNNDLTNIEGPKKVKFITCDYNNITTIKGGPIVEEFSAKNNPINELIPYFGNYNILKKSIEDYDYIRGKNIIKSRLIEAIEELSESINKKYTKYEMFRLTFSNIESYTLID